MSRWYDALAFVAAVLLVVVVGVHIIGERVDRLDSRVEQQERVTARHTAQLGPLQVLTRRDHCALLTMTTDTTTAFQKKACQP